MSEDGCDDGVTVCGLNPGSPQKKEMEDYRDKFIQGTLTYAVIQGYWEKHLRHHPYLEGARRLVRCLGFRGPILWTNVAKCEREDLERRISFDTNPQTFRFCADRFLRHEIKACPEDWPIIANGKDAFVAVSYMFPERLIIGIPHPTGAHPNFSRMFLSLPRRSATRHRPACQQLRGHLPSRGLVARGRGGSREPGEVGLRPPGSTLPAPLGAGHGTVGVATASAAPATPPAW